MADEYLKLPVFYVVIEDVGTPKLVALEATQSIHRARGICRELKAQDRSVAIATYTADAIVRTF